MELTNEILESKGFRKINNSMWRKSNITLQSKYVSFDNCLHAYKAIRVCVDGIFRANIYTEDELDSILKQRVSDFDFKKRVLSLINSIPNIESLEICPSVFSDDLTKHYCDDCPMSVGKQGDTFDSSVCIKCWSDAVMRF